MIVKIEIGAGRIETVNAMRRRRCLLVTAAATLVASPIAGQTPRMSTSVDSVFTRWMSAETPGCAVGVYDGDRVVYAHGYGLANVEHNVPVTSTTVFRIGGLSKQFTALALVLLVEDGKLSLDDPARKYVPELPDFGGTPITIRLLLNQTTGLREFYPGALGRLMGAVPGDVVSTPRILDDLRHQQSLDFPAGSRFGYSNTNFALAGEIVRRVSGKALPDFARARIFAPLNMTQAAYIPPSAIVPHHATAYTPAGGTWIIAEPSNDLDDGSGTVNASVEDLARWNGNMVTHRVGGDSGWAMLTQRARLNSGNTIPYALGLQRLTFRGQEIIGHQTRLWGYHSAFFHFPRFGGGVSVFCNRDTPDGAAPLAMSVAVAAWPTRFAPEAPPLPASVTVPTASIAGVYFDSTTRMLFSLDVSSDTVRGRGLGVLRLIGPDRYLSGTGFVFQPLPAATGRMQMVVTNLEDAYNVPDTLTRLGSIWQPAPADLAAYVGKYYSSELDATVTVTARADGGPAGLVVTPHFGGAPFNLNPAQRDVFAALAVGGNVRFLRDANGRVARLEVNFGARPIGALFDRAPQGKP